MSKDRTYRRLIESERWLKLSLKKKTEANWQCSRCGRVTQRLCVHHTIPVETAMTEREMESLCFNESLLQVLCYKCHADVHKQERWNSREQVKERASKRVSRFMEMFTGKNEDGDT